MERTKEFIKKHKKATILAAVLLVLIIAAGVAAGIRFSAQPASADVPAVMQSEPQTMGTRTDGKSAEASLVESVLSSAAGNEGGVKDKGQERNENSSGNASPGNNAGGQNLSRNSAGSSGINTESPSTSPSDHAGSPEAHPGSGTASTGCNHEWVTRTETVQEPTTVIVTSEQQEYTLYRFYWYTSGTWEETRDSSRFDEWYHSADGSLYPLYNPYEKPEDNPLFLGYDGNGNPTYTNDHTILSGLFEEVPCEPYEKTEITTMTITTTVCSKCGAIQ